jgi:hypothetical protein
MTSHFALITNYLMDHFLDVVLMECYRLSVCGQYGVERFISDEVGNDMEGGCSSLIEALSRNFPG